MATFDLDGEIEQRYRILRHIGSGAYGVVWCALDRFTGRQVALKKVFDAFGNQEDAQRTYREVMLLQNLRDNDRVVGLLNVIRSVNDLDLYMVFELAETDLTVVLRKQILQDVHRKFLTYQIIKVVAQLHEKHIIHRDLKPANVFVNTDCTIKLGDFGLARSFCPGKENDDPFVDLTEYIATRWYRSPEILVKSSVYSTAMDMWAVGCIIGELFLGQTLFPGKSTVDQLALIVSATGEPSEDDVDSLQSQEAWPLIDALPSEIIREPLEKRLEEFDPDAVDLVTKLIVFSPAKRLTAVEALRHPYVAAFVTPEDFAELQTQREVVMPLPDYQRFTAHEYKKSLYQTISKDFRHHEGLDVGV